MKNYCKNCNLKKICNYAFTVRFCKNCKDYSGCEFRIGVCEAGHEVECSSGYVGEENE